MSKMSSVPMQLQARDELRQGLGSLRTDELVAHPVEQIQKTFAKQERTNQKVMMARIYGQHMPIKMHMEEKILTQFRRMPGLPSSHLGLETILGVDTDIDFADFLNSGYETEQMMNERELMDIRFDQQFKRQ